MTYEFTQLDLLWSTKKKKTSLHLPGHHSCVCGNEHHLAAGTPRWKDKFSWKIQLLGHPNPGKSPPLLFFFSLSLKCTTDRLALNVSPTYKCLLTCRNRWEWGVGGRDGCGGELLGKGCKCLNARGLLTAKMCVRFEPHPVHRSHFKTWSNELKHFEL